MVEASIKWENRGKTIQELIDDLNSFSDKGMTVRISVDDGETDFPISILDKTNGKCIIRYIPGRE